MVLVYLKMLISLVAGTLVVLGTQLVLVGVLAGVGLVVRRAAGLRVIATRDVLVGFWVGLAMTMLFLTAWTFVLRVSAAPLAIVTMVGAVGLVVWREELRSLPRREPWLWSPWVLVLLALAALWVASAGRGPLTNSDTMLYHFQGVRWAQEYPTVPGLANLYGPLGFNNASFLYDAMVDVGPWHGQAYHFANGVLILPLLWQGLLGLVAARRGAGVDRVQGFYDGVLIGPALNMGIQDWMRSFVTGLSASSVMLIAAAEAHRLLQREDEDGRTAAYRGVVILALLSLAVTFKINLTIFAGLIGILVLWHLLRDSTMAISLRRRAALWGLGVALLTGGLWTARGIVLSGYLVFPTASLSVPVEWRAPKEHAIGEFGFAAESARATVDNPAGIFHEESFRQWVARWWKFSASRQPFHLPIPASLALTVIVLFLFLRLGRRGAGDPVPLSWLLLVSAAVATVVWFRVAPEPRYAAPFIWTSLGVAATACYRLLGGRTSPAVSRAAVLAMALIGVSPLIVRPLIAPGPGNSQLSPLRRVIYENLWLPGPNTLLLPPRGGREIPRRYSTDSGLDLNVTDWRCWDTPLPCTPNPAPNLRLRIPGRMEKGFVVDGPWQMENWPANRVVFRRTWAELRRRELEAAAGR